MDVGLGSVGWHEKCQTSAFRHMLPCFWKEGRKEGRRELPVIFRRTNLGTRSCAAGLCSTTVHSQHTNQTDKQLRACTWHIHIDCYSRETGTKTRKMAVWRNGLTSSKKDQNLSASCKEKLLFCSSEGSFLYSLSTTLPWTTLPPQPPPPKETSP